MSYTPGTTDQTIAANQWLAGQQIIQGDANLVAANIKKGVSIFNVAGSYEAALDTNSAILKVVTSTGCSVTVTNGTDTFTQQDADGFVRPNDANVTEHFFVIPTAAFGDFDVTVTHPTYGPNTKTRAATIGNAGKVYEVLCGGKNIILDNDFGLQDGYTVAISALNFDSRTNCIVGNFYSASTAALFLQDIPVAAYNSLGITIVNNSATVDFTLKDEEGYTVASATRYGSGDLSAEITNKKYPTAKLYVSGEINKISKIVLT
jgi:hypothetical protein